MVTSRSATYPSANVYEELAESWYHLRHFTRFHRQLITLGDRWRRGRLLNIGCGHGPDFLPFAEGAFDLFGIDSSREMLRYGQKYAAKFRFSAVLVLGDAVRLPFDDNTFDHAIAIAIYHHIKDENCRLQAYRELHRVLKSGGEAFITVWNLRRSSPFSKSGEVMVPWMVRGKAVYRYVYVYRPTELRRELMKSGFRVLSQQPRVSFLAPFYRNIAFLVAKRS